MDKKTGGKPESSRLNLFYILQVLERETDEEHPLSAAVLAEKINTEFGYLSLTDTVISMDTVKRILDDLLGKVFIDGADTEEAVLRYGYWIYCVTKKNGKFVPFRQQEGRQVPKKYYYLENGLKAAELLTLKDAMETYSYFSEEDITDVIRKITRLRPHAFPRGHYIDAAGDDRDENSLLLMNISDFNEIICHRNSARIVYCAYDSNKKLVPRPGYPKVIEPVHLMWSNGYYYLVAYHEKYDAMVNLRVDRITEVEEVEIKGSHHVDEFNPVQYRHEHPIMFGGKKERIELLCRCTEKNYFMNTIMDVFGKKARVAPAENEILEKYLRHTREFYEKRGMTWLHVTIESAPGGVELWAVQYCADCRVIAPETSVERVKRRLERGLHLYG